jgi:hypothetical protein
LCTSHNSSNSHLSTKGEAENGAQIGESSQMEGEYNKRLCSKLLILKLLLFEAFNVEIAFVRSF